MTADGGAGSLIEIVPARPDVQPDDLRTGRLSDAVVRRDLDPLDPPR